jgi:hypothetical protein
MSTAHATPDWADAACHDSGLDFVPDHETPDVVRDLKAVCAVCPRSIECVEFAIPRAYLFGVWGGLTTNDRAAIRRVQRSHRPVMQP